MLHEHTLCDRGNLNQLNDSSSASGSELSTSALDRLRYNLSPVTSYYKPLMKSLTKRNDSPYKVSF